MKRYTVSFVLILVIVILFGLMSLPLFPALTIANGKSKQLVFAGRIQSGQSFAIHYIHSIHRTPVQEEYFVDENLNIVLNKVVFESYGVGNPSSLQPGETFHMENGKFVIDNMNRTLPYFDQAIGQIIADHHLRFNGQWIALAELSPAGTWVRIQVKKLSLFQIWSTSLQNAKGTSNLDQG